MQRDDEEIVYLLPSDTLPESTDPAWSKVGSGTVSYIATPYPAYKLIDASGTDRLLYHRPFFEHDRRTQITAVPRARPRAVLDAQITIAADAYTAWTGTTSPVGFWTDDGERMLGVSVGTNLRLVNPATGATIKEVFPAWDGLNPHAYLLRKDRHQRWLLWVDGKLVAEVAYEEGVPSQGVPSTTGFTGPRYPLFAWGVIGPAGTATTRIARVETGCNVPLPPQWKVERFYQSMPVAMQARWSPFSEALLRASVGLVERGIELLNGAFLSITAAKYPEERATFKGDIDPVDLVPPWGANGQSIVRQRVRLTGTGAVSVSLNYTLTTTTTATTAEYVIGATMILRSYTVDGFGRVGPVVRVADGVRQSTAQLVETGTGAYAWVLTDDVITAAPVVEIGTRWPVDPFQETRVEVRVYSGDWCVLMVDGEIVDKIPYSLLPLSGVSARGFLQIPAGPAAVLDLTEGVLERNLTDLTRRPLFLQRTVENLIPTGGCERNDELEVWTRGWSKVHHLRGTTQGLVVELRRLTCSEDPAVVVEQDLASWFLELTWPDLDAVYLELGGYLSDVFVESPGIRNMTLTEYADYVARYMLPISVIELQYFFCLAAIMTANTTVPGAGLTRITIPTTDGFAVGDTVTVRDAANTVQESTTVSAIVSDTVLDVVTVSPRVTGDVIRKVLSHS